MPAMRRDSRFLKMARPSIFSNLLILFLFSGSGAVGAEDKVSKIIADPNLFSVRRKLETLAAQTGPEQGRAFTALIALERLSGHGERAINLLKPCLTDCLGRFPKDEIAGIKSWACKKNAKLPICRY